MTDVNEGNLKPCPFCGGTDIEIEDVYDDGEWSYTGLYCKGCDLQRPFESESAARKWWNTRTAAQAGEAQETPEQQLEKALQVISDHGYYIAAREIRASWQPFPQPPKQKES